MLENWNSHDRLPVPDSPTSVLLLPGVEGDDPSFMAAAQPYVSETMFRENWEALERLIATIDPEHIRKRSLQINYLEQIQGLAYLGYIGHQIIGGLRASPRIESVLSSQLPDLQMPDTAGNMTAETMFSHLLGFFRTARGNTAIISPSHVTTHTEIHAARTVSRSLGLLPPDSLLGLLIFDEHTDFCIDDKDRSKSGPLPIMKKNFLLHLLNEGTVDSICIVGPTEENIAVATKEDRFRLFNKLTYTYYKKHRDRIHLAGIEPYIYDGQIDRLKLINDIPKFIRFFGNRNVTHMLTSVDVDVLNAEGRYTGYDYNPLSAIVNLGTSNLRRFINNLYTVFASSVDMDMKAELFLLQLPKILFEPIGEVAPDIARAIGASRVKFKQFIGLPEGLITKSIRVAREEAHKLGIIPGIPLPNGLFTGNVAEAQGLDYEGRTGKVTARFIRELLSV